MSGKTISPSFSHPVSTKIKQRDRTDCGAACIASIASHYKLHLPVSHIRQLASTDKRGTTILGLVHALDKLGFQAKGVRGGMDSLSKIPMPAIAHVVVKEILHHYVVIYKVSGTSIEVMDPGDGQMIRYTHEEFKTQWTGVLVILLPGEHFQTGNHKHSVLSRFWSLIRPHKSMMTQALLGAMVYTLIGLTTSVYVQKIVDYVLVDSNTNLLNLMSIGMIALLLLQQFIGLMKSILTLRTGQSIDIQLILGYYKHLLTLPQSFFDTMRVGEIISRVNDAVKIRSFINEALASITVNFFIVVFSFGLMFTYYWKLALVVLLIVPFYSAIYYITNRVNKAVERKLMENAAELESQLVESLNSVHTIKDFGLEEHFSMKTETTFLRLLSTVYTSGLNTIFAGSTSEFFSKLVTIILLWAGAGFVLNNELTPGELLSFYALTGYFTGPVSSLIGLNKAVQNALIAADRLFEIMDVEREKEELQIDLTPAWSGNITFKNVTFRYGASVTVFEDLNLEIPKGNVTAIVGESGSGKSTLMALLQRLYPLNSGQISIGDCNVQYITPDSLRRVISIVPQKIDLFTGNVVDNIAVGDYRPDINKILTLCSDLGILDFIEKLPNGFTTWLGENGATLSGGQKQRIAIARALYKDPEILILDEATSSLDSGAEHYIRKMTDLLRERNKTVIMITHRLSSVIRADKIVVLEAGKVAEEGRHEELLRNKGAYYRLWEEQFAVPDVIEKA
ncbi:MAG TPA: peptidase domain-containing ABC transporter [Cyclobacteriaceae bacterium]|nr:peptidase domain-containing ABC transporter [Cyclobacteriaceae bacterium]